MPDLDGFLAALDLDATGERSWRATNMDNPGPVVFGGQMLAQTLVAAERSTPGQTVKSLHTVFARAAQSSDDLDVEVEPVGGGRSFSSLSVSLSQGERLCARSLVLTESGAADLIRHSLEPPPAGPAEAVPSTGGEAGATSWWEIRVVDGVDIGDPDEVGPPRLGVWMRFPGAGGDPARARALLAYASDGFLIGTALRPHAGFGQSLAHVEFNTTVLTHTLSFHEPFSADEWLLLDQEAPYAGRGRSYGRAHVWTADGRLVASFVQDAMIRAFPPATS